MKKRVLAMLLTVVMIVSMIPLGTMTASAEPGWGEERPPLPEWAAEGGWDQYFGAYEIVKDPPDDPGNLDVIVRFDYESLSYLEVGGDTYFFGEYVTNDISDYLDEYGMTDELRNGSWIIYSGQQGYQKGEEVREKKVGIVRINDELFYLPDMTSLTFLLKIIPCGYSQINEWNFDVSTSGFNDTQILHAYAANDYKGNTIVRYLMFEMENGMPVLNPAYLEAWTLSGLPEPQIKYCWNDWNGQQEVDTYFEITAEEGKDVEAKATIYDQYTITQSFRYKDMSKKYYFKGKGTQNDPYKISKLDQLIDLAAAVNEIPDQPYEYNWENPMKGDMQGKYFQLTADIDGMPMSIGSNSNPFKGNFDGNGFTVSLNMTVSDENNEPGMGPGTEGGTPNFGVHTGLFGQLGSEWDEDNSDCVIQNLSVKNTSDENALRFYGDDSPEDGGTVCNINYGTILDCTNIADIDAAADKKAGGICGTNYGTIESCTNYGTIAVLADGYYHYFGGICGSNEGTISGCVNHGPVEIQKESPGEDDFFENFGGISGYCGSPSTIVNCINYADIDGGEKGINLGGICGLLNGSVLNCLNMGAVSGDQKVGGVCGVIDFDGNIKNCVSTASITGREKEYEDEPYSYGGVLGGDYYSKDAFEYFYFDKDNIEGDGLYDASCGLSTAQMKANHGEIITGEDVPQDGKALVDLLNEYIDQGGAETAFWWHWTKDIDGYPYPVMTTSKITVIPAEHGKVTVPSAYMVAGVYDAPTPVSVTDTPEEGYALKSLKYNDGSDHDITAEKSFNIYGKDVTLTAVFGLAKSAPTADDFTVTLPQNPIYDGESKAATPQVKEGVTGMGTITVKYSSDNGSNWSASAPVDAGTYQVALDVEEGDSYQAASGLTNDSWKFTIAKGNQTAPGQGEGYTLNYVNETLVAKEGYEVSSTNTEVTELPENKVTPGNSYYVRKKGNSNYEDSAWLTIQVPARPATTASVTNTTITVKPFTDAQYKLGDGDWQNSNVFTGLTPGTAYTVTVKIRATESSFAAEQTISVTTLNAQIVTQGSIEVEVQGETRPENAKVKETITDTDEKEAASAIAGAINSASSAENKSNIVDLTEVVSKKIKDMTMESVQALAEKNEKSTDLTNLLNAADAAKDAGKTVYVSMKMTTDINVAVTNVKVNETEKTRIETFTLDISPVYTLVVESIIKEDGQEPVSDTVTVADGEPLEVTETTVVSFPAPDGFALAEGDVLYVVHEKQNGEKYTYVANYNQETKMISFTNPHGFSEFSMVKASGMVAQNVTTGVFYNSLVTALAGANEGETVVLLADLTGENNKVDVIEVAPNVTLDLNGFDLEARLVIAFGLVQNNQGSADGKLITAQDHFAYFGGKEMAASNENVLPVWDTTGGTNGYVFYAVSEIKHWALTNNAGDPKYMFQPKSNGIQTVLGENSGVRVYVDFSYTQTDSQGTHHKHLTVEFGRSYLTQFLADPDTLGMYVTLLGTEGVSNITAKSYLKAENCNFSIESAEINLSGKTSSN